MRMSQNQSHHLIINSLLGNYVKGDTGENDGISVSEDFPLPTLCSAGWQHWGLGWNSRVLAVLEVCSAAALQMEPSVRNLHSYLLQLQEKETSCAVSRFKKPRNGAGL